MTDTDTVKYLNTALNGAPPWKPGLLKKAKDPALHPKTRKKVMENLKRVIGEIQSMLPVKVVKMTVGFLYGERADQCTWRGGRVTAIEVRERGDGLMLEIKMEGIGPPQMKGEIQGFEVIRLQNGLL